MNAEDVLKYGNLTVLNTLDGVPQGEWETPNVCGRWSVKDIVAHLASFEHVLMEVLTQLLEGSPASILERQRLDPQAFNDVEVAARQSLTPAETLAEYVEIQSATMALIARIPLNERRRTGALPWYGMEYDLEDFIAYQYYGHKREHCSQINVFRDSLDLMPGKPGD